METLSRNNIYQLDCLDGIDFFTSQHVVMTQIEWTHRPGTIGETWNVVTGCNKVDRGCKHCYAETMHRRLRAMGQDKYTDPFLNGAVCHQGELSRPSHWVKPRTVFVNSMSDLFHPHVPLEFLESVFTVMACNPRHTFLVLTKRTERALEFWDYMTMRPYQVGPWQPEANVWIGTSINDQASADKRVPQLLRLPCALRFVSYEPATGEVNLRNVGTYEYRVDALNGVHYAPGTHRAVDRDHPRLHWVIMGGESGAGADPMHPDWPRRIRDDCHRAGVPFFFKQWGAWEPVNYYTNGHQVLIKADRLGRGERLLVHPRPQNMRRTAKKDSNLLDCQTWQQFPDVKKPSDETTM